MDETNAGMENVGPDCQPSNSGSISRTEEPECQNEVETLDLTIEVQAFKAWTAEIGALVDECHVKIDPTGLIVRAVDPAHIAMIETVLPIEVMDVWHTEPTNAYVGSFAIDLDKLKTYLKVFKAKDRDVKLTVHVSTKDRKMTIEGPNGSRVMTLIDSSGFSDPKVPILNLPLEVAVKDAKAFRQALKGASEVSDHIALRYESATKTFWVECETKDSVDSMKVSIDVDVVRSETSTVQQTIEGEAQNLRTFDARSLFPLEYLVNMSKGLPDGFKVELGNNYPIKLAYGLTVKLLAPRIESDD